MTLALFAQPITRMIALSLLVILAGCESSNNAPGGTTPDAATTARADGAVPSAVPDAALAKDTFLSGDSSPDTTPPHLAAPDATGSREAGREDVAIPTDTRVAADSTPLPTDTASRGDALLRADVGLPDTRVTEPDADLLACQLVEPTPPLGNLTPQQLKAILDSGEDVYLINVKGTSIANIPGTDAVLANDVAGIETFVGGRLCANIIIYCRTSSTSQSVGNQLVAKGYQNVRHLSGGITAWTAAGYATL